MILADGCFDPFHVGHLRYLKAAQAMGIGDLWVRLAGDDEIRAKGREPFQTIDERVELISAFGYWPFREATLANAIRSLEPDILVKGDDWHGRLPAEVLAACTECGTVIRFTPTSGRTSTERLSA